MVVLPQAGFLTVLKNESLQIEAKKTYLLNQIFQAFPGTKCSHYIKT